MLKIIPIILLLSIFGGCVYTNLNYTHEDKDFAAFGKPPIIAMQS